MSTQLGRSDGLVHRARECGGWGGSIPGGSFIQQRTSGAFPFATLIINITGSLLPGFRYGLESQASSPEVRALLTTGFCGGYTTFSAFSHETARLLEGGDYRKAAANVVLSVVVSLAGTFTGFALAGDLLAIRRRP